MDLITPVATARTTEDLVDGAALTIDYTLRAVGDEWRRLRLQRVGPARPRLRHLTASEREAARPRGAAHPGDAPRPQEPLHVLVFVHRLPHVNDAELDAELRIPHELRALLHRWPTSRSSACWHDDDEAGPPRPVDPVAGAGPAVHYGTGDERRRILYQVGQKRREREELAQEKRVRVEGRGVP